MISKTLPQKTFNFTFKSEIDESEYAGLFVVRRKVISDEAKIRVRQTQLNGGLHYDPESPGVGIDPQTNYLNYMIATLQVLLVQVPDWFDLDNLFDANIVADLWKEVRSFQDSFRKKSVPVNNGSSQGGSQTPPGVSNESGDIANMAFSQVWSSVEQQ